MTDEIRPANIHRPRRVRPASRDDREENEERFRKKLAELVGVEERQPDSRSSGEPDTGRDEVPARAPSDVGRHLDVQT